MATSEMPRPPTTPTARTAEHVAERIALHSTHSLGEPSLEWAQRVREGRQGVARAVIAEQLRTDSAKVAAIDGAIAATPFLIALIPGYLLYLRQEARMLLRTAALYDRDPRELETAAEMLALRGVHPTVDEARAALLPVRDKPLPEKPAARRPWRTWVRSVYVLLIYGGFLSAPSDKGKEAAHPWVKTGDRGPVRADGLGGHLGVPAQLHDRDGLGLRQQRA